jgi:hypothetical protein
MLETPEERIKLLKAGYLGKTIEKLFIERNNFKIVRTPPVIELVEFDIPQDNMTCLSHEMAAESV